MWCFGNFVDQCVWDTAQAKATAEDRGVRLHVRDGLFGRRHDLVDLASGRGRGEGADERIDRAGRARSEVSCAQQRRLAEVVVGGHCGGFEEVCERRSMNQDTG